MDELRKALNTLEIGHLEGKVSLQQIQEEREKYELIKGGGEGSRGGKVIGHTKSGKPIYEYINDSTHHDKRLKTGNGSYNVQDHKEAIDALEEMAKPHFEESGRHHPNSNKHKEALQNALYYRNQANTHLAAMNHKKRTEKSEDPDLQKALQTLELAHMAGQIDKEPLKRHVVKLAYTPTPTRIRNWVE